MSGEPAPTEPSDAPAPLRRLMAVFPDLAPYRDSRDFRLLWWAGTVTVFGNFLTVVALPLQIKQVTGSALAVGAVGLVELVPLVVFGLYGGALADAFDRRTLITWAEAGQGLLCAGLLANAVVPHPALWPLYAVAGVSSALMGVQRPALDAVVPRMVERDQLAAAAALNSLRWQVGAIAGPSLAGVLIAFSGVRTAYVIDLVTCGFAVVLDARLRRFPAACEGSKPSLRGIAEGARYAWGRPELLGTYAVDIAATFFAFPVAVFPFLAAELRAQWALGLMYAAESVGSLVVSATSGWVSRVHRHGLMVVLAAAGWGAAIGLAGVSGSVWLVLLWLAVAGGCDMVSGIFRSTIWNQTIPDALRGRLAGIELLSYSVGPQLGQVRSGGMASLSGVRVSVWSGGVACVAATGALALALPRLLSYDASALPGPAPSSQTGATTSLSGPQTGAPQEEPPAQHK